MQATDWTQTLKRNSPYNQNNELKDAKMQSRTEKNDAEWGDSSLFQSVTTSETFHITVISSVVDIQILISAAS